MKGMRKNDGAERSEKLRLVGDVLLQVMPLQYPLREKLKKVALEWSCVVGTILGNQSAPLDVVEEELLVAAETPLAASRLSMMGGNVVRVLAEKWGLKVKKVKVVVGRLPLKNAGASPDCAPRPVSVNVGEGEARKLEWDYLKRFPDLPESVSFPLAHLQAFFTKRFGKRR
jgi:hypothetical protein